jgi:haloalkane dehalogenase
MDENHPSYSTLHEIESRLSTIHQPKLILWGGKDFCFDHHFFERFVKLYPEAEAHWFAKAGHYVLEDALVDVSARIWEFIK